MIGERPFTHYPPRQYPSGEEKTPRNGLGQALLLGGSIAAAVIFIPVLRADSEGSPDLGDKAVACALPNVSNDATRSEVVEEILECYGNREPVLTSIMLDEMIELTFDGIEARQQEQARG
jgi:hypothetical protein